MAYEKMPCLYETEKDLIDRLGNTICRYKGVPYYVQIESAKKLNLYDLVSMGVVAQIKPSDPDFDISSMEIGYMNYVPSPEQLRYSSSKSTHNRVYYLERIPYRKFRQGISSDVVVAYPTEGQYISSENLLRTSGFKDALTNKYPSISEAMTLLQKNEKEVAVSIDTALTRTDSGMVLVHHRRKNIAWINPGEPQIVIPRGEHSWVYQKVLKRFVNA